ncbi:alpha/beta hydrolase-fold protein [Chryseobacterium sp. MP_3.2]|uniref:alpha/beta hydrolase-fold protein n=1 Tax=Chryseobacterium sp. MP_3.2 TaxID=3071712 RepID=UPI002E02FBF8|nr:putative alpha/beta superfamily hydrolase [Chryseobacterium sp. MP_3.2]
MKKLLFFLLFAAMPFSAQITVKITAIPTNTPAGSTINVAGNFNGWNPSSTVMVADGLGNYSYTIPEGSGILEYKFTRGSWPTAEGNATGGYLPNRTATFTRSPQTLNLTVQSWEDQGAGNPSTAASNVKILSENFSIPQLNRTRKIWIYLPPDYETSTKTYPVIYMQDGQNLFDNRTSFSGEWQVDETLNALFANGDYGAIVIGIDNGGSTRINEYTPWNNAQYGGGEGDLYMQFVAETLKPYVDANYRTKPAKEYNALIGSSLGALISNYGGVKYSGTFSKIGSFSPAYWIVNSQFNNYITTSTADLSAMRIYFVAGSGESATLVNDIQTVKNNLQTKGLTASNTLVKIDSYGQHNENYWKGEFSAAYQWLFQTTQLATTDISKKKIEAVFGKNQIFIKGLNKNSEGKIYEMSGKLLEKIELKNGTNDLKNALPKGNYILQTETESVRFLVK